MKRDKYSFLHESIQDRNTIRDILKAITDGIGKGKLNLSDEEDEILLRPEGLLNLKISACKEDNSNRVAIRIAWQSEDKKNSRKKDLKVSSK